MRKPPKPMRVMLTLTLAPSTIDALDQLSEAYDLSRGRIVDAAIRTMLDQDAVELRKIPALVTTTKETRGK